MIKSHGFHSSVRNDGDGSPSELKNVADAAFVNAYRTAMGCATAGLETISRLPRTLTSAGLNTRSSPAITNPFPFSDCVTTSPCPA